MDHEQELDLDKASEWQIADLIIDYLNLLDVDFVFGVPGGAIEPLYNALARSARRGGTRPIVARHETGAAFMADGYYRQTRKLAVCCATTGPGATNLVTGVASAYANEIPMLVITAQTSLQNMGRGAFQESSCTGVNTVGIFQPITKFNTLVSHPDQLEHKLTSALMQSLQPPYGPVHLSIPCDILKKPATLTHPSYNLSHLLERPALLDENAVQILKQELAKSEKSVFIIGPGCSSSINSILQLADTIDAELVTTPHAKGLISSYHPRYRGVFGFAGHQSAKDCLSRQSVNLIIAFGTNMTEWASDGWNNKSLLNHKLIHIDAIDNHFFSTPMARLHVRGDIETVVSHLLKETDNITQSRQSMNHCKIVPSDLQQYFRMDEEEKCQDDSQPIKPQSLMRNLTDIFPPHTRYLADTGNAMAWSIHYLHPYDRRISGQRHNSGGLLQASLEYASMGWAIGAAVGTALGNTENPVVCITGDGSVLMSGQELTVAVQEKLPVIFVILNDAGLGMVKHGQRLTGAEAVGYELPPVDFATVARAMGAHGFKVETMEDLHAIDIPALLQAQVPTVLDIRIDGEEVPPMKMRTRSLGVVN